MEIVLITKILFQRKAWSPKGNGDSGESVIHSDCRSATNTTAHSKVSAAPGANPQPQGKKKCNELFLLYSQGFLARSLSVCPDVTFWRKQFYGNILIQISNKEISYLSAVLSGSPTMFCLWSQWSFLQILDNRNQRWIIHPNWFSNSLNFILSDKFLFSSSVIKALNHKDNCYCEFFLLP